MKEHLTAASTWLRGFIMLIYIIIGYIAIFWIAAAVIIFQFGSLLFTGKLNERLLPFGQSLSIYISQILLYLTYNTDDKPFPFSNWPNAVEYNKDYVVNRVKETHSSQAFEDLKKVKNES